MRYLSNSYLVRLYSLFTKNIWNQSYTLLTSCDVLSEFKCLIAAIKYFYSN